MNLLRVFLPLICPFFSVLCANAQVDTHSVGLVGKMKGLVTNLDSADLTGDANARVMRSALDKRFQVLGIGEQSHGTSEFFLVRLMLIKALADDPAFTKIGLEAPMAETNLCSFSKHPI